jgi:hypothetical protein
MKVQSFIDMPTCSFISQSSEQYKERKIEGKKGKRKEGRK